MYHNHNSLAVSVNRQNIFLFLMTTVNWVTVVVTLGFRFLFKCCLLGPFNCRVLWQMWHPNLGVQEGPVSAFLTGCGKYETVPCDFLWNQLSFLAQFLRYLEKVKILSIIENRKSLLSLYVENTTKFGGSKQQVSKQVNRAAIQSCHCSLGQGSAIWSEKFLAHLHAAHVMHERLFVFS